MRVVDHLSRAASPPISFEIIPPRRGSSLADVLGLIEALAAFRPPFIDITSHPAEAVSVMGASGKVTKVTRKRPGTLGLCALVQYKYRIDAVPHVLCSGFTREETEDFLIELRYLGIDNLLALRGDDKGVPKHVDAGRSVNTDAASLVAQLVQLNRGTYLDGTDRGDAASFCIGVAGYPEKHGLAPSLEADLDALEAKVRAGADYVVTQMFFNCDHYRSFVAACRTRGITVPIIPGLKVLTRKRHLEALPRIFGCELPDALRDAVNRCPTDDATAVGIDWAIEQGRALLAQGAPALHFYVMQDPGPVSAVARALNA